MSLGTECPMNVSLTTSGNGFWSRRKAAVPHNLLELVLSERGPWAELRVFFSEKDWSTKEHGLIYTDEGWLQELHNFLMRRGFSPEEAQDVQYSEQGMQGDNFVSLDVGRAFLEATTATGMFPDLPKWRVRIRKEMAK